MDTRKLLDERGSRYGDFKDNARIAQQLKDVWRNSAGAIALLDNAQHINTIHEGMEMVLHKIARICNGDPLYKDNWQDIIGYSQLVLDELNKQETCLNEEQQTDLHLKHMQRCEKEAAERAKLEAELQPHSTRKPPSLDDLL